MTPQFKTVPEIRQGCNIFTQTVSIIISIKTQDAINKHII